MHNSRQRHRMAGKQEGSSKALLLAMISSLVLGIATLSLVSSFFRPVPGPNFVAEQPVQTQVTGYTFWSSDFHISPVSDLKDIFQPMGMTVIDKSLSSHCHLMNTCAKGLKVLTKRNGIDLGACPNKLKQEFFEQYKNDPQMQGVDAFLCNHACSMCEVFMPFNKSLIVIASTRYEIGRHSPERWMAWNDNLRKIAANPRNLVGANNLYDLEYIKYFTGIQNVHLLPNNCGYTKAHYSPSRPEILVGPGRKVNKHLLEELKSRGRQANVTFATVRDLYPKFEYSDVASHRAIVLIPYQVSIMSIFEYYRMAIPMFAPSLDLLTKWVLKHRIMAEWTWEGVRRRKSTKSPIPAHPSVTHPHDPNNDYDENAVKHWLQFSDFYQWPHIQTYDSWDDLLGKLESTDLQATSQAMQTYNTETLAALQDAWQGHFRQMFDGLAPAAQEARVQEMDFGKALRASYGVTLSGCHGQQDAVS